MATINLGDKARDTITGYTGICIGRFEYLNGCVRIQLLPTKLDKDGKPGDGAVIDEPQLELVKRANRPLAKPSGGPRDNPASRRDPVR